MFNRWRWVMVWVTQLVFYGLPWLQWGERQMVLFDLGARRFYLFGLVLYPQDFIYLTGLLILSALSLFLFTAVAGRLWCGFTCPQTVYTEIFMWLENRIEGDRSARMRLDKAAWTSPEKLAKKGLKQLAWVSVALWTGFTFVGFFVPIRTLGAEILQWQGGWQLFWVFFYAFATYGFAGFMREQVCKYMCPYARFQSAMFVEDTLIVTYDSVRAELLALQGSWQLFWIGLYSLATYGFAGYMREQVCKYMCPYARFQSAMFDKDTLVVTYDSQRGEPRGARSKKVVDYKAAGLGDCIDCSLCVQVCPTGIDIRNGLQYECIGCGLCVDACNTVMDKVGYPRGLIRFATQSGMRQRWTNHQMLRRVFRPRVLGYGAVLLTLAVAMMVSLVTRTPLKVDVVRDRTAIARIVPGGKLENVYQLQIMNATETPQHYRISAQGLEGLTLAPDSTVQVPATGARWVSGQLQIPYASAAPGSHPIHFTVQALEHPAQVQEKATFLVPR